MALFGALVAPLAAQAAPDDPTAYVIARAADADGAAEIAAAGYAAALAQAPDDEIVAIRAYRQALAAGDLSLASRAAAVLVKAGVAPPDTAILAFTIALHAGDRQGAHAAVMRMSQGPLDFMAPVLGAWLDLDRGDDPFARLDDARGNALARRYNGEHRALLLLAQGRTEAGLDALRPAITSGQEGEDLRIDAAHVLAALGDRNAARALLAGDQPELAVLRARKTKRMRPDARFGASRLFLRLASEIAEEGMESFSILLLRSALLLDPEDDRARLYLAEALSRDGNSALALKTLAEVSRDSPYARGAAAGTVAALDRAGRDEEALARAKAMSESAGATSADAQSYATLLDDAERYDAAAAAYALAIDRADGAGGWQLQFRYGSALERAGRWDEARKALLRAVALDPDQPALLNFLGYAQVERGEDMAAAQALLERASALRPGDAHITDSLGWAYYRQGDVAKALPLLERAAKGDPGGSLVNEHLGDAYWRAGRHYEARYAWRAAALYADAGDAARIEDKLAKGLTGTIAAN